MSRQHKASWDVLGMAARSFTAQPAAAARARLQDAIEAWEAAGLFIPCRFGEDTARWTSDDPDAQRSAAVSCGHCPALAACQGFAITFPYEAGVYGGWTEHDRRKPLHKRNRRPVAS